MVFLKSVVLAAALINAQANTLRSRTLSLPLIAGYAPRSDVSDHLRIDLDQQKINEYLDQGVSASFKNAQNVYEKGAYSKSVASITLAASGLPSKLEKGDLVVGKSTQDEDVVLMAMADISAGATSVELQYKDGNCNVGGLPGPSSGASEGDTGEQNWEGCLNATGSISSDSWGTSSVTYKYDVETDNTNARSIQYFSSTADEKMRPEASQPFFTEFQKFYDYYGDVDYGDKWVTAAFDGSQTSFSNGRGDADFSIYDLEARAEGIKKGTAYMNTWMYVIRELDAGIAECSAACESDDCEELAPTNSVDEAVAFYTGSLEGTDGTDGEGYMIYALANKRSANFKTGGANGDSVTGNSKVNIEVFQQFDLMRTNLINGKCDAAKSNKDRIVQLMTVPLIQAVLRYAHIRSFEADTSPADQAEGASFAASVIPMVYSCNQGDADTIYQNMKTGQSSVDFSAVKSAFENNYGCLGITCADVGGFYDQGTSSYMTDAAPCGGAGGSSSNSGSSVNVGLAVGLSVGAVAAIALVYIWCKCCRKTSMIETKSDDNPIA